MSEGANIEYLPASSSFNPDQALASAAQLNPQGVLVVGYDEDGHFFIRSSSMTREQGLWLIEWAKMHALGLLAEVEADG